eukprot:CAMPEP_0197678172 /NCGR_PEP_ID=MMETSP1338-20131121/89594_1 /TAXON_ID=43686 ORGANISM="Pelagodinium beii, Strain RCC1491" /NCGR_SAMPLE_ID=MMETSP1338 /ASSEMBLY_ACC=CAM_ASM_000754 /LENGTH=538 /DNA_ID=CAMNT_0043259081 /DNA_START=30 /DNA_END=1642 /DNA_ORIENTATION=+
MRTSGRRPTDAGSGDHRKTIKIAQEFVGMLIGKGGENIKAMSRDTGAKIDVSRDDGERDADRTVTISGSREAVDKAAEMVEEVANGGNNRSGAGNHASESDAESDPEAPPGFEPCEYEEWLYHEGNQEYFNKKTGRLAWRDASTGMFGPIREGETHQDLLFVASACTGLSPAGEEAKTAAPKTVVIPDLHRVAQMLKVPFDHVDKPASMMAVFRSPSPGTEGVPVDVAARSLHDKLIRRIASWRSAWMDQAWLGALTGAIFDVSLGFSGVQPILSVALVVGRRIVASSTAGARICVMAGTSVETCLPVTPMEMQGAACCFQMLPNHSPEVQAMCIPVALTAGQTALSDSQAAAVVAPHILAGRPRAASAALMQAGRKAGAKGHLAVAVARLGFIRQKVEPTAEEKKAVEAAAKKLSKTDEVANKVRVRQILIRFWSGKGPQPANPVTRKPVTRKIDEAEMMMVDVLDLLLKDNCKSFPSVCKASSECQSAMKGGADTGDLGWLDHAKVMALAKAKGQPGGGPKSVVQSSVPVAVVKAA